MPKIDDLKQALAQLTPGEWNTDSQDLDLNTVVIIGDGRHGLRDNSEGICALKNAAPWLIEAAELYLYTLVEYAAEHAEVKYDGPEGVLSLAAEAAEELAAFLKKHGLEKNDAYCS